MEFWFKDRESYMGMRLEQELSGAAPLYLHSFKYYQHWHEWKGLWCSSTVRLLSIQTWINECEGLRLYWAKPQLRIMYMIIKRSKRRDVLIVDVIIPTNLVRILFDPAIPTSSFNFIIHNIQQYYIKFNVHVHTCMRTSIHACSCTYMYMYM